MVFDLKKMEFVKVVKFPGCGLTIDVVHITRLRIRVISGIGYLAKINARRSLSA
jgi:hypothetical protein